MKRISKEAEAKVLDALGTVANLVNEVDDPNKAIIKAATEYSIPAGHINLMVLAYNTGRTNKQRLAADDPTEKSASFVLADPKVIMEALYPSEVKTKAEEKRSSVVSADYSRPPVFAQRKSSAMKAARYVDWKLSDKPEQYAHDPKEASARAYNSSLFNKQRMQSCRRELSHARDTLARYFEKLGAYFRTPGSFSFADLSPVVAIQHGNVGKAVMKQVARAAPLIEKQGASGRLINVSADVEPFTTITACVKLAKELAAREKDYSHLVEIVEKRAREKLSPFVHAPGSRSVLGTPSSGSVITEKVAGVSNKVIGLAAISNLTGGLGSLANQSQQSADKAFQNDIEKFTDQLADPSHELELKRIRSRAMLEDLLANDPVISGYGSADVLQAYNDIVELAPRAADQRMLLQGLLRRHLAGEMSTDPFDVQQNILGSEKLLAERDTDPKAFSLVPGRNVGVGR
jgi:hypothetical protein